VLLQQRKSSREHNDWDQGAVAEFLDEPATKAYTTQLRSGAILHCYTQEPHTLSEIAETADALCSWLDTPRGFKIHLVWRHDPRQLEASGWPDRRSVNGGWTIVGSNTINIYRSEEWDRVFLHEAIHALGWDWEMPKDHIPCWKFSDNDVLYPAFFEAWTELYAEWLWCGFHNVSWTQQRAWQDAQAVQILARARKKRNWRENTSVFAYYVLKAALAPHIGFLWTFRNGITPAERMYVLCNLIEGPLAALEANAERAEIRHMSLRMTRGGQTLPYGPLPPKKLLGSELSK
jgi:hypothetical protein